MLLARTHVRSHAPTTTTRTRARARARSLISRAVPLPCVAPGAAMHVARRERAGAGRRRDQPRGAPTYLPGRGIARTSDPHVCLVGLVDGRRAVPICHTDQADKPTHPRLGWPIDRSTPPPAALRALPTYYRNPGPRAQRPATRRPTAYVAAGSPSSACVHVLPAGRYQSIKEPKDGNERNYRRCACVLLPQPHDRLQ